jgi:hypothetical protein
MFPRLPLYTCGEVEFMDTQAQQLELKRHIIKGKEQGFLTFKEINDHLPGDMNDTDQIETVVNMINDMGIEVFDKAPDPDSLLLKTANPDDEEVVEEAEAVLTTAVESEFGRIGGWWRNAAEIRPTRRWRGNSSKARARARL